MFHTALIGFEETKQHGTVLFPFNIYPCNIPGDFPSVALHWHKSFELIYVKKGCGVVQLGSEHFSAAQGDIFIVPPDTLHALRGIEGVRMEYENFICETELLGSGAADICAREYLIPLAAGQLLRPVYIGPAHEHYNAVRTCLVQAEDLCEAKSPAYELGVKAAMLHLVMLLIRMQPSLQPRETEETARLKRALGYVQDNFARKLTVAETAEHCNLSASHFMRWFRAATGSSFSAYVKECRLSAAAERLRLTGDKILVIAHDTGYDSLANFNRQFKTRYGMTPAQYRGGKM